jgi:hypothetical protein
MQIRSALLRIGMWPTDDELARFAAERDQMGRLAVLGCLPVLGPGDWAAMLIDEIDVCNDGTRRGIASMGAFGWGFSAAVQMLISKHAVDRRAAGVCATFNIGTSLLDAQVDGGGSSRSRLARTVDEATIAALGLGPLAAASLRKEADGESDPSLRWLLKFVAGFYHELHELVGSGTDDSVADLVDLLAAFKAEMATQSPTNTVAFRVAKDRAVLPFHVMASISMVRAGQIDSGVRRLVRSVTTAAGEAFGLVDDLVDLPDDDRTGHPNVVLARVGGSRSRPPTRDAASSAAGSRAIEASVGELARRMAAIRRLAHGSNGAEGSGTAITRFMTMYVAAWTRPLMG